MVLRCVLLALALTLPWRLAGALSVRTTPAARRGLAGPGRLWLSRPDLPDDLTFGKGRGAALNAELLDIFNSPGLPPSSVLQQVGDVLRNNHKQLNHVHAVTVMQRAAKIKYDVFCEPEVGQLLLSALRREGRDDGIPWRAVEISQALYGCRLLSIDQPHAIEIVRLVVDKLKQRQQLQQKQQQQQKQAFSNKELGSSFFGLQRLPSGQDLKTRGVINELVHLLSKELELHSTTAAATADPLTPHTVSNILYGLRQMNEKDNAPAVLKVVSLLTSRIRDLTSPGAASGAASGSGFTAQGVTAALNGLQGLSDSAPEVRALLAQIALVIPRVPAADAFLPIAVGSALMSLHSMGARNLTEGGGGGGGGSGSGSEALAVVAALTSRAERDLRPGAVFDEVTLCSALNGLSRMEEGSAEVRRVLALLASRVAPGPFAPQSVSLLLNSLQHKAGEVPETRAVLELLAAKLKLLPAGAIPILSVTEAALSVFGFNSMKASSLGPEALQVLGLLGAQIGAALANQSRQGNQQRPAVSAAAAAAAYAYSSGSGSAQSRGPAVDAAQLLFGLRGKAGEAAAHPEIRALLAHAHSLLLLAGSDAHSGAGAGAGAGARRRPLSAKWLSLCMLGLDKADLAAVPEARAVLDCLAGRLPHVELDGFAVSSALRGLNGMSSDEPSVLRFVAALTAEIRAAGGPQETEAGLAPSSSSPSGSLPRPPLRLIPSELEHCYFGLRNLDTKHPETRALIAELVRLGSDLDLGSPTSASSSSSSSASPTLAAAPAPAPAPADFFTSAGLGFALTGLQTASSDDSPEVLAALAQFADWLDQLGARGVTMAACDLANALLGLQGMSAQHEEVRAVIVALTAHLERCQDTFTPRDLSFCVLGLSENQARMQLNVPEVRDLLGEIAVKVSTSELKGRPLLEVTYGSGARGEVGGRLR